MDIAKVTLDSEKTVFLSSLDLKIVPFPPFFSSLNKARGFPLESHVRGKIRKFHFLLFSWKNTTAKFFPCHEWPGCEWLSGRSDWEKRKQRVLLILLHLTVNGTSIRLVLRLDTLNNAVQLEGCWWPPKYVCHYCTARIIGLSWSLWPIGKGHTVWLFPSSIWELGRPVYSQTRHLWGKYFQFIFKTIIKTSD